MTQALWTSTQAATATNGKVSGDWQASSVEIDSRAVAEGALFVAIVGERVDGHDYVKQALENGAAAAMVSKAVDGVDAGKLLIVEDTFRALQALGMQARARTHARIIGVTGSVGKTTTKEALRVMVEGFGRTHASMGNLNNHYGAPLSLANMPADTEFGVFEMGMNHAGEISALTKMVRPHVAIITAVEAVHLEFFDSEQDIARAKAEIFEGLEPDGVGVLNADNEHTEFILSLITPSACGGGKGGALATSSESQHPPLTSPPPAGGIENIITFGQRIEADIRLNNVVINDHGCVLDLVCGGHLEHVALGATGKAAISAALVCLSVAKALDLDLHQAALSLASVEEVKGRGRIESVSLEGKQMWWVDDSYNASPASMRAAFEKIKLVKSQKGASRAVAVLGDMLELGTESSALHAGLAADIVAQSIDQVYTVGPLMEHLQAALPENIIGGHTGNINDMCALLKDRLHAGDVVLFKGSNGSKIHQLVKDLQYASSQTNEPKG